MKQSAAFAAAAATRTVFARVPDEVHAWLVGEALAEAERTGRPPSIGTVVRMILVHAHRGKSKPNGKKGK